VAYSGDPSASGVDAVRFWVQDTGTPGLLTDDEIDYLITFSRLDPLESPIEIAATAADRICAKYAGRVSINADGVSYSGETLQQKYSTLADRLRKEAARVQGGVPFVGGLHCARQFSLGMGDNPEGHSQLHNSGGGHSWFDFGDR
jgi:hypothetical protein